MRTTRWVYDYFKEPYELEAEEVFFKLLPSATSFNSISSPYMECILPDSYYDNVESFFNRDLRCKLYKDVSNQWIFDLPIIDVYFGDKPPYYTKFNYIRGQNNYVIL